MTRAMILAVIPRGLILGYSRIFKGWNTCYDGFINQLPLNVIGEKTLKFDWTRLREAATSKLQP